MYLHLSERLQHFVWFWNCRRGYFRECLILWFSYTKLSWCCYFRDRYMFILLTTNLTSVYLYTILREGGFLRSIDLRVITENSPRVNVVFAVYIMNDISLFSFIHFLFPLYDLCCLLSLVPKSMSYIAVCIV